MVMSFANGDKIYHVELNNKVAAYKGNGVLTGLGITAQSTPSMTLDVAIGKCHVDNEIYTESSGTTVVIGTAHATHPRLDLVCYDTSAGAAAVTAGTASATPIPPDIPSGDILLALVSIPATDSAIENSQIDDSRLFVRPSALIFSASDNLKKSDDASSNQSGTSYTKEKEFDTLPDDLLSNDSELRIKFDLASAHITVTAYGRIYKNGVAVGTEQTTTSTSYVTFSEDISNLSAGDLIQLYTKTSAFGNPVYVQNFRAYGDYETKTVFSW